MKHKRLVVTDVEGPVTKNDIAQEIYSLLIPNGSKVYPIISDMDDLWSEMFHPDVKEEVGVDSDYRNGGTLKWILPQLKAVGVNNQLMTNVSVNTLKLINGSDLALSYLQDKGPIFMISTSYEQYLDAVSDVLKVSRNNIHCTELDLDKDRYTLGDESLESIKKIQEELRGMERFDIPDGSDLYMHDFPEEVQPQIERLNLIFWKDMLGIPGAKELVQDTDPIGGTGKVEALYNSLERTGVDISETMGVGDSITDMRILQKLSENGGLPVSFNGSPEAVKHADIGIMSHHVGPWIMIADVFLEHGKDAAMDFAYEWSQRPRDDFEGIFSKVFNGPMRIDYRMAQDTLTAGASYEYPAVAILDELNRNDFARESSSYRKRVRGVSGAIR